MLIAAALIVGSVPSERWRSWMLFAVSLLVFAFGLVCLYGDRWQRPCIVIHSPSIDLRRRRKLTPAVVPTSPHTSFRDPSASFVYNLTSTTVSEPFSYSATPEEFFDLLFAHVRVENIPKKGSRLATNVVATLTFTDAYSDFERRLSGRWAHSEPEVTTESLQRPSEITLAANGNSAMLHIVFKYDDDDAVYAFNDENLYHASSDYRYNKLPVPCTVEVVVRGTDCGTAMQQLEVSTNEEGELRLEMLPEPGRWERWIVDPCKSTLFFLRKKLSKSQGLDIANPKDGVSQKTEGGSR